MGTRLISLPTEILKIVAECLSGNDAASFALCNHTLFCIFGNEYLSTLHSTKCKEDRDLFLTTLTRDLPGHFFCHYCSRLHLRDHLGPPGPALQPRNRLLCVDTPPVLELRYCFRAHPSVSWYRMAFSHLQLAMKRHRGGPGHGISPESLSFTEVRVSGSEENAERVTTLLSVEARICSQPVSLCLRIQQRAVISFTKRDAILSMTRFVMICDHLYTGSPNISRLIESKLDPSLTDSGRLVCPEVFKCQYCYTDFQIEIKELVDKGLALVITKWIDLGSGLTPTDIKWRVHRASHETLEIGVWGSPGNIRLRFESEPGLSQASLSCQNGSYLIANWFMRAMDQWDYETWVLQAGRRLPFFDRPKIDRLFWLAMCPANLLLGLIWWWVFLKR